MKRNICIICMALLSLILVFQVTESSAAVIYTFSDNDFLGGASWGTMTVTAYNSNTLMIRYDAAPSSIIPSGSEVTGFGFTFSSTVPNSVINPLPADFSGDRDDLNWTILSNLNAIPNPSNGDEFVPPITKFDYSAGVTEGNSNNINPPGILPGEFDVYYVYFTSVPDLNGLSLNDFISITGIRIQCLPTNEIGVGSLFLAGQETVPETSALLLLGSGLLGFALYNGRRFKK
jgi:hypothetical protein